MESNEKKTTVTKKVAASSTKKSDTKGKKTTNTSKSASKGQTTNKKATAKVAVEKEAVLVNEVKQEVKPSKKKIGDVILILGLVIVVVLGFVLMKGEERTLLTLSGEDGLHQLTYQEYQEKIDNNEAFVLIIERATCSHCVTYMPIAEEFAEQNKLPMYYVDTDTFTEEDWAFFEASNTFFKKKSGSWGTPTTLVLSGDKAVGFIEGTTSAENLLDLYNKYFDISKE